MIFTILTTIVFISELIIANTLISKLRAFDKVLCEMNGTVAALNPKIKDVGYLIKNISAQCVEFAYDFISKLKNKRDTSISNIINKLLIMFILWKVHLKFIQRIKSSRFLKRFNRGLSLLKYMIQ